jgi:hypothetical protein
MVNTMRYMLLAAVAVPTANTTAAVLVDRTTAFGSGADSFIDENAKTTVRGGEGVMTVKWQGTSGNVTRAAYLRFDLSGLASIIPGTASDDITVPNLRLTANTAATNLGTDTFEVWGLTDGTDADRTVTGSTATGGWLETGTGALIYNNAFAFGSERLQSTSSGTPAGTGILIGTFSGVTPGETVTVGASPSGATVDAGFAANLATFLQADTNGLVTLMIQRQNNTNTNAGFFSKENTAGAGATLEPSYVPQLSFTLVPEPAALGMLGLAALPLLGRRRLS